MVKTIQYANKHWVKFKNCLFEGKRSVFENKLNVIYSGACSLKYKLGDFYATNYFRDTCLDFCCMMFTQVLMKELARILIYVRKIFNCRMSFKMLLSMCLATLDRELCDQVTSRMALLKKIP